jgi:hypothetical protein
MRATYESRMAKTLFALGRTYRFGNRKGDSKVRKSIETKNLKRWSAGAMLLGIWVISSQAHAESSTHQMTAAVDENADVGAQFSRSNSALRKQITSELVAVRYEGGDRLKSSVERVRNWNGRTAQKFQNARPGIGRLLRAERYEDAYQKLRAILEGIRDSILDDCNDYTGPYVTRLVVRGSKLFEKLDDVLPSAGDDLTTVTKINLLLRFMDLIPIVDREFDQKVFPLVISPEMKQLRAQSDAVEFRKLQHGFIDLVQSQLYFLNSTFDRKGSHWVKADPVGEPEVYIVALQIMSYYAARDISNNLFGYENSQAVDQLESLREELIEGGEGRGGLGDLKSAYYYSLGRVDQIIRNLEK